jgi:hypothetical protein
MSKTFGFTKHEKALARLAAARAKKKKSKFAVVIEKPNGPVAKLWRKIFK